MYGRFVRQSQYERRRQEESQHPYWGVKETVVGVRSIERYWQ